MKATADVVIPHMEDDLMGDAGFMIVCHIEFLFMMHRVC